MTGTDPTKSGISLTQFTLSYLLCLALIIGITTLLKFEVPSAMGIIALMAAASAPAHTFAAKNGRVPTKSERNAFAVGGTLISLLLSLAITAVAFYATAGAEGFDWARGELQQMWNELPWLVALLPVLMLLVPWLVLYFGSGMMAKQALKASGKTA